MAAHMKGSLILNSCLFIQYRGETPETIDLEQVNAAEEEITARRCE